MRNRVAELISRVQRIKAVRVFTHYGQHRGPILAAGLSFQAIFSVFAAIWVGFSIAGLVLAATPELRTALFELIGTSVPGLIDSGNGGALDPDELLSAGILGWTGALALAGTLFTAVSWLGAARDAVRDIADLAAPPTNFLLLKAKDLGLALAFAVALVASAALSFFSTQAAGVVLGWFAVDEDSVLATIVVRTLGLLLTFALDAAVLAALYRVLAGVPIPRAPLFQGSLLGALALGILKALGATLLGGAVSNPLLASFAVIIGLLIWFNFVCQVILLGASWVVVTAVDRGVPLDPVGERRRREAEARLRLEIEEQVRAELEAQLPRAIRWFATRSRRRLGSRQN
ncbi:MAG TPA: YhjD/YihY/BrkB family envelope integrity protein [Pseudolysinimonas sp.]|nr:YhjD/YihY/BrkB family envelope integrity protein [Pseudolysinimonas sp.]